MRIFDGRGDPAWQLPCGDQLVLEFLVDPGEARQMHYGGWIQDSAGTRLFTFGTHLSSSCVETTGGLRRLQCAIGPMMLAPGRYTITLVAGPIYNFEVDSIEQAATFELLPADVHGNGRLPNPGQGVMLARSSWNALDLPTANGVDLVTEKCR
jgi:hypothetical protein